MIKVHFYCGVGGQGGGIENIFLYEKEKNKLHFQSNIYTYIYIPIFRFIHLMSVSLVKNIYIYI